MPYRGGHDIFISLRVEIVAQGDDGGASVGHKQKGSGRRARKRESVAPCRKCPLCCGGPNPPRSCLVREKGVKVMPADAVRKGRVR